eukprot:scaffold25925_cov59-Attheya_sp.AAC.5
MVDVGAFDTNDEEADKNPNPVCHFSKEQAALYISNDILYEITSNHLFNNDYHWMENPNQGSSNGTSYPDEYIGALFLCNIISGDAGSRQIAHLSDTFKYTKWKDMVCLEWNGGSYDMIVLMNQGKLCLTILILYQLPTHKLSAPSSIANTTAAGMDMETEFVANETYITTATNLRSDDS